jgi:hypothetical protein
MNGSRIKDLDLYVKFPAAISLKSVSVDGGGATLSTVANTYYQVAIGSTITLEFTEPVSKGVFYMGNTPLTSTPDTNPAKVNIVLNAAWTPGAALEGAVVSAADEANKYEVNLANIVQKGPPVVLSTNFDDVALGVTDNITITFDRPINSALFQAWYVGVTFAASTGHFDVVGWNLEGTEVTLKPAPDFTQNGPTKAGQLPYDLNGTNSITYSGSAKDGTPIEANETPAKLHTEKSLFLESWSIIEPGARTLVYKGGGIKLTFSKNIGIVVEPRDDAGPLAYNITGPVLDIYIDADLDGNITGTVGASGDEGNFFNLNRLAGQFQAGTIVPPFVTNQSLSLSIQPSDGIELTFNKAIATIDDFGVQDDLTAFVNWDYILDGNKVTLTHKDGSNLRIAADRAITIGVTATDGGKLPSGVLPGRTVTVKPPTNAYVTTNLLVNKFPAAINHNDAITMTFTEPIDTELFSVTSTIATPDLTNKNAWVVAWANNNTQATITPTLGRLLPPGLTTDDDETITIAAIARTAAGGNILPDEFVITTITPPAAYVTETDLYDSAKVLKTLVPATVANEGIKLTFNEAINEDLFEISTTINPAGGPDLRLDTAWVKTWSNNNKTVTLKPTMNRLLPYGLDGTQEIRIDTDAKTAAGGKILADALLVKTEAKLALVSSAVKTTTANDTPITTGSNLLVQKGDQIVFTFNKAVGKNSKFTLGTLDRVLKYAISGEGKIVTVDIDVTLNSAPTTYTLTYEPVNAADINDIINTPPAPPPTVTIQRYEYDTTISIVKASGFYTNPSLIFYNQTEREQPLTGGSFQLTFDRLPANATVQAILVKQAAGALNLGTVAGPTSGFTATPVPANDRVDISYSATLDTNVTYLIYIKISVGNTVVFDSDDYFSSGSSPLTDTSTEHPITLFNFGQTSGNVYIDANDVGPQLRGITFTTLP